MIKQFYHKAKEPLKKRHGLQKKSDESRRRDTGRSVAGANANHRLPWFLANNVHSATDRLVSVRRPGNGLSAVNQRRRRPSGRWCRECSGRRTDDQPVGAVYWLPAARRVSNIWWCLYQQDDDDEAGRRLEWLTNIWQRLSASGKLDTSHVKQNN